MPVIGTEKEQTAVGHGIDLLTAEAISKEWISTYSLVDMDQLVVESMPENLTAVEVLTENSKVELAKSLSVSVGVDAQYMGFSASVKVNYDSSSSSSSEKAYTMVRTLIKKRRQFFPDDSFKDHLTPAFKEDLYKKLSPAALFKKYGTHILRDVGIGGSLILNVTTTKDKNESKETIAHTAKAAFAAIASANSSSTQQQQVSSFLERSHSTFTVAGGNSLTSISLPAFFTEYPSWVRSVQNNPSLQEFCYLPNRSNGLVPIWELLPDNVACMKRKMSLKNAYEKKARESQRELAQEKTYVTDILITAASNQPSARSAPEGYQLVEQDLNLGVRGQYIYLCYKTKTQAEMDAEDASFKRKPLTNLLMVQYDKAQQWGGGYLTDGSGRRAYYNRIECDLNQGAGGRFIYLCYTRSEMYAPLTAIDAYVDNARPASNEWDTVCWNGTYAIADTNKGAGGNCVFLLQKHEK